MEDNKEQDAQNTETETTQDESQETESTLNLEQALDALKKARNEAAANRVAKKQVQEEKDSLQSKVQELTSSVDGYKSQLEEYKDYKDVKSSLDKLKQENQTLKLETKLAGKVVDTKKAIKLVDESYYGEDGEFNVDKFLEDNSFLAAKKVTNPAHNKGNTNTGKTTEDLSKLSQEDMIKFFEEYTPNK